MANLNSGSETAGKRLIKKATSEARVQRLLEKKKQKNKSKVKQK